MKLTGILLSVGALVTLSSCSIFQQQETGATAEEKTPEAATPGTAPRAAAPELTTAATPAEPSTPEQTAPTPEQPTAEPTFEAALPRSTKLPPQQVSFTPTVPAPQTAPSLPSELELPEYTPEAATTEMVPDSIPGGLRMRRFAPPEEAVSSSDEVEPAPNSVELHGFRSPGLKGGKLPMNINGKINQAQ